MYLCPQECSYFWNDDIRSTQASTQNTAGTARKSSSNPFGAAKPREEVLAKKGIDAKLVDLRIEKKSTPVRLTSVSIINNRFFLYETVYISTEYSFSFILMITK